MVRKSLLVVATLAVATPVAAQEEYVWTSNRPDGHAPIGVIGDRTLPVGETEISYRFSQMSSKGIWLNSDSLPLEVTLEFYQVAPLTLTNQTHTVSGAYGVTEDLTLFASIDFSQREREQLTVDNLFYVNEVRSLGDMTLLALYDFYDAGPIRAHAQFGSVLPTGSVDIVGETPFSSPDLEYLPYDMRPGTGTFALLPGMTVSVQNEHGSVGAQVGANIPLGDNSLGFAPGRRVTATGWGAYRINEYFSVSGRVLWQNWDGIDGADPFVDPQRDPGNDAFFLEGERIDVPVGLNFYMPEDSRFGGHRLAIEAIFPISHDYTGPQLGLDWGVTLGWQMVF